MPQVNNGDRFPDLPLRVLDTGDTRLAELTGGRWSVVTFYRDDACPRCQAYMDRVAQSRDDVIASNVQIVAISADTEMGARAVRDQHDLWFPVAHSAPLSVADELGLYTNPGRGCFEPAFFVLDPDGRVRHASIQSGPAARPAIEELLALVAKKRKAPATA